MPLPWYLHTMTKVFSFPLLPVYPFILPLEAMRGAFLSGTSLALFIDIPTNPSASAGRELDTLRGYLDFTKKILEGVPANLLPLLGPWIDYYHACECFCEISRQLHLQTLGLPDTCKECWAAQSALSPSTPSP